MSRNLNDAWSPDKKHSKVTTLGFQTSLRGEINLRSKMI